MIGKVLFIVAVLGGVAYAAPGNVFNQNYDLVEQPVAPSLFDIACNIIQTVIASKISAVGIVVHLIEWVVSNLSVIIFGAIAAFGFCKLTDLCNFNYEEYVPVGSLESYATPERIETAEKIFLTALDKYAEKNKREI